MGHSEQASQQHTRPSLLSKSDSNNPASINILSSLEVHKKTKVSKHFSQKKLWYFALVVIAITASTTTLLFKNEQAPATNAKPAATKAMEPLIASTKSNIDELKSIEPTATEKNQAISSSLPLNSEAILGKTSGLAALIINEPTEKSKLQNTENPFIDMLAIGETMTIPTPTSKVPAISAEKVKLIKPTLVPSKPVKATNFKGISNKSDSEKTVPESIAVNNVEQKNEPNQKPKTSNSLTDNDITLLSALISHENTTRSGTIEKNTKVRQGTTNISKMKTDKQNQDIVERRSGNNTKNLLLRCKKLGGLEAKLCRIRICSGQWANELACAVPKGTIVANKKT